MFLYSLKNCCDGYYCPEEFLVNDKEYTEVEFFEQIQTCINELYDEPFKTSHEIRNLFKKMLSKQGRPVDFDHVMQKMCDTYGYQTIQTKHSYALWQTETKIIKNVNEYHTSYYRDIDKKEQKERYINSAGSGGFWDE